MSPDPTAPSGFDEDWATATDYNGGGLGSGSDAVNHYEEGPDGNLHLVAQVIIFNEEGVAEVLDVHSGEGYITSEHGYPMSQMAASDQWDYVEEMSGKFDRPYGGPVYQDIYYNSITNTWIAEQSYCDDSACTSGTKIYLKYNPETGQWEEIGREQWKRLSGVEEEERCGSKCYCCESHTEYQTVTNPDGSTSTESYTVCDRYCKKYTCHWKECSGCCCVPRSQTYTVDCNAPCPCPSSTCSSNCDCCRRKCPISVILTINPTRLFVNQQYNLTLKASSPSSCCGSLTCTLSCKYEGANCGKTDLLRICPSDVPFRKKCLSFHYYYSFLEAVLILRQFLLPLTKSFGVLTLMNFLAEILVVIILELLLLSLLSLSYTIKKLNLSLQFFLPFYP